MRRLRRKTSLKTILRNRPLTAFDEVIYAVGDIHGRKDLLDKLMSSILADFAESKAQVSFPLAGRIVFLGDYIDRGPDSCGVISALLSLNTPGIDINCLKGNHEAVMLSVLENPSVFRNWLRHGGVETLISYGVTVDPNAEPDALEVARQTFSKNFPEDHRIFLENLPSYHERAPLFFVHAGVDPEKPLNMQGDDDYLWIREAFLSSRKPLESIIVHGHTPQDEPSWDGRRIGLDTGAYFTNRLNSAKIHGKQVEFIST